MPMKPPSVDDDGDDYGLRGETLQSSTVVVAVVVHRNGQSREEYENDTI